MKTGLIRMGVVLILSVVLVLVLVAALQQHAVAANPGAPPEPDAAPRDLRVTEFYTDGFSVTWTPVTLTVPAGEYRWQLTERPAGPSLAQGATADLQTAAFTVHGLQPGHTYYIEVRTWVTGGSAGGSLSRAATLVAVTLDSRTVLVAVYFAADNDLAPYIPLIGERLRAGAANNPNARLLYFADGAADGDSRIWLIAHGVMTPTNLVEAAWGVTELDSAD
ncbi:MAG: fibronectin type III domain-containing protein, partial [Caldilineaceae bacterium]|nr:fibronectin type III domain-containing protein [Caldilineaceae bacterium]